MQLYSIGTNTLRCSEWIETLSKVASCPWIVTLLLYAGDHPLEFSSTETKSELILALRQNSLLDQKTVRTCFDQEALR